MGYQTNFQQKNIYLTIEKRLIDILNNENNQNYENFINPSSNLSIANYNYLLDSVNRKYLKKK